MNRSFLSNRKLNVGQFLAVILSLLITFPQARANEHVLSIQDMHEAAFEATMARQANQADIDRFLQSDKVKDVMRTQRINEPEVRKAIATLSDADLAKLAQKARTIESDLAAGRLEMSDGQTTLFLLGFFFLIFLTILVIAFK